MAEEQGLTPSLLKPLNLAHDVVAELLVRAKEVARDDFGAGPDQPEVILPILQAMATAYAAVVVSRKRMGE